MNPKHQNAALYAGRERQMSANFALYMLPAVNQLGGVEALNTRLPAGWGRPGGFLDSVLRLWGITTADQIDAVRDEPDMLKKIEMMGGKLLQLCVGDSERDPKQGGVYVVLAGLAGPQAVDPQDSLDRQATNLAGRIDDPEQLLPLSIEGIRRVTHLVRTGDGWANPTTLKEVMSELRDCALACSDQKFHPCYVGQTIENSILGRTGDEWDEPEQKAHGFVQYCSEFYSAGRSAFDKEAAEDMSFHRIVFCLASVQQMEGIVDSENAARDARGAEHILYSDVINLVEQVGIALCGAQILAGNLGGLNVASGGAGAHEETHVMYNKLVADISFHLKVDKEEVDGLEVFPLIKELGRGGENTHLRLHDRLDGMATWRLELAENTGGVMEFQPAKADVQSMGVANSKNKDYLLAHLTMRQLRIASCAEGGRRSGGGGGGESRRSLVIKWGDHRMENRGEGPGGRGGRAEGGPGAPEGACVGLHGCDAGALEQMRPGPAWFKFGGPNMSAMRKQLTIWGISLARGDGSWPVHEEFRVRTAPPSLSHTLTF